MIWLPAPLLFFLLLGTEAPRRFWGLKQRLLLCPSRNLVTCVGKHQSYHTVPHHSTLARPGQASAISTVFEDRLCPG